MGKEVYGWSGRGPNEAVDTSVTKVHVWRVDARLVKVQVGVVGNWAAAAAAACLEECHELDLDLIWCFRF